MDLRKLSCRIRQIDFQNPWLMVGRLLFCLCLLTALQFFMRGWPLVIVAVIENSLALVLFLDVILELIQKAKVFRKSHPSR